MNKTDKIKIDGKFLPHTTSAFSDWEMANMKAVKAEEEFQSLQAQINELQEKLKGMQPVVADARGNAIIKHSEYLKTIDIALKVQGVDTDKNNYQAVDGGRAVIESPKQTK